MLTLGSLCSGYGGLDLAAEMALGPLRHAWHCENDPDASKVLAAHWPGVPNHGDLTAVDWSQVEPVDVVTAGFPCQDVSSAGRRAGIKPGTRSGVWSHIAYALGILRPRLVLIENVEGLLSGPAHSDVEPCPWCLGDTPADLVVRALGAVLADLATLGFDAEWATVPASDVGAPHRRRRVFIVAWPAADADESRLGTPFGDLLPGQPDADRRAAADGISLLPTPNAALGRGTGFPSPGTARERFDRGTRCLDDAVALLPTPRATDATKGGPNQRGSSGDLMLPSAVCQLLPTPTATPYGNNQSQSDGAAVRPSLDSLAGMNRWGAYGPAIARWEQVTGRSAPEPTEPGTKGQPRLAARFVEWMMGLSDGWVTAVLGRNASLRVLGNGVVPQQASRAYSGLLRVAS